MADILGPSIAEAEKYANAKIGFQAVFMDYLERDTEPAGESIEPLVMETESTGSSEEYIFAGDLPQMEPWKEDRRMAEIAAHKLSIANEPFATGVPISRIEIMDDKLGIVNKRIEGLAGKAKRHRPALLTRLLLNGFTGTVFPETGDGTCYTGSLFFSDSHSLEGGSAVIDNKMTSAFSESAYEAMCIQMAGFTTWDGADPLEIALTHLFVGPKNEFKAKRLVGAQTVVRTAGDGGETNIHYGSKQVVVLKRLVGAYADYWFGAACGESLKPLIFQKREDITTAVQADWSSDDMFKRGKMNFGVQARYGCGYFDPRLMIGSTGAG